MPFNKTTGGRWYELNSQQGRNPTITPGAGPTSVQFLLNALPAQKDSKFWYYVESMWITLRIALTLPSSDTTFPGLTEWQAWQILQSLNVQCPLLGQLYASQNTRGSVLGNIIQRIGFGYNRLPQCVPAAAGTPSGSPVYYTLRYRVPFAHRFLSNPMDTAPWAGFLEGGTVQLQLAPSTVYQDPLNDTNIVVASVNVSAALYLQPLPEARIHTPFNWREHQTPGSSTKHIIPDIGSPDGLQGIDQSKGVGVAHLSLLTGPQSAGLTAVTRTAAGTAPDAGGITSYQVPWRDQQQILNAELAMLAEFECQGVIGRVTGSIVTGDMDFPAVVPTSVPDGNTTFLNESASMIFPIVSTGAGLYSSKLQTVSGAKEIDFTYSGAAPSATFRWCGLYFGVFDEQFQQSLVQRIAPGSQGLLTPKTINKQPGGSRDVGKLAYTPNKIKE